MNHGSVILLTLALVVLSLNEIASFTIKDDIQLTEVS